MTLRSVASPWLNGPRTPSYKGMSSRCSPRRASLAVASPQPIVATKPDIGAIVGKEGTGPERQEQPTSRINLALDPVKPAVHRTFPRLPQAIRQDAHLRIKPAQVEVSRAYHPAAEPSTALGGKRGLPGSDPRLDDVESHLRQIRAEPARPVRSGSRKIARLSRRASRKASGVETWRMRSW